MFLSISTSDIGRLLGVIFVVVLLAAFGKAILFILCVALVFGLVYGLSRVHGNVQTGKMHRREVEIRTAENTHTNSPLVFSGKVMAKAEDAIRSEVEHEAVIDHIGSQTGEGTCIETYQVAYTMSADFAEEQIVKFRVVFIMDARSPHAADLQLWELDVWPEPLQPFWTGREASLDRAAEKIASAVAARRHYNEDRPHSAIG